MRQFPGNSLCPESYLLNSSSCGQVVHELNLLMLSAIGFRVHAHGQWRLWWSFILAGAGLYGGPEYAVNEMNKRC